MDETCCCCLVVVSLASALVERRAGREGVREMCPGAAALVVFELEIIVFILVFGRAECFTSFASLVNHRKSVDGTPTLQPPGICSSHKLQNAKSTASGALEQLLQHFRGNGTETRKGNALHIAVNVLIWRVLLSR